MLFLLPVGLFNHRNSFGVSGPVWDKDGTWIQFLNIDPFINRAAARLRSSSTRAQGAKHVALL